MLLTGLDILLVAVVIYEFLVLVKGTRATQVLLGFAVIAVAFYVATLGQLPTVGCVRSTYGSGTGGPFRLIVPPTEREALLPTLSPPEA